MTLSAHNRVYEKKKNACSSTSLPLCIDLDGTLIRTDMLLECLKLALKKNVFQIFHILLWFILGGRPRLKKELANLYADQIVYEKLPYQKDLINWLKKQKEKGKILILVTGSWHEIAKKIAMEVNLFDEVYGTEIGRNLTGQVKAKFLQALYPKGFLYAGNEAKDLKVWKVSKQAVFVNLSENVRKKAYKCAIIPVHSFGGKHNTVSA